MEELREILLRNINHQENILKEYQQKYKGQSPARIIKKIFKYRKKYIKVLIANIFNKKSIEKSPTIFDKPIYVYIPDICGVSLYNFGLLELESELKLTKYFIKTIKESDVFFDIGANYGFYSLLATNFIAQPNQIHLFEPNKQLNKALLKTFKDSKVVINHIALSDNVGKAIFYNQLENNQSSVSSLFNEEKKIKDKRGKKIREEEVETNTLDNYCKVNGVVPTIIKLDVEGAELMVINGGINILKNNKIIIAMEVWMENRGNESHMQSIVMLTKLGYTPHFITSDGLLKPIKPEDITKSNNSRIFDNVIFKN